MRLRLVLALFAAHFSPIGVACDAESSPWLDLQINAGELADSSAREVVQVFADGCVQARRPAHFVDPGWYTLQAASDELQQLAQLVARPALRDFEQANVEAQLAQAQRGVQGRPAELFAVLGADRYVLTMRSGSEEKTIQLDAVFQLHERYPDNAEVQALAGVIAQLQAMAGSSERRLMQVSP